MSTTIKLRRSSTPGSLPSTSSLANGEVVLNTADGKLFFKKTVGGIDSLVSIRQLNSGTGITVDANGNINATGLTVRRTDGNTGAVSTTISNVTGINFDALTGFNLEDLGSGNVFVSLGSTFKTLQVAGQTSLVAMGEDTLVINAGAGISITTSTTPAKTLTISSIISAGYTGSVGYSGSIGSTGYTGSWGYYGSTGYTGSRGTDGVVGYWGSVGYSGSVGATGYTGSWGYFGSTGYTGSFGSTGYTGSQGYWGSVGYSGSLGNTGYTGSWGYFGSTGYTGSQGYWGSTGYTGSLGYFGSTGYTGSASTAAGYIGSTGYVGSRGAVTNIVGTVNAYGDLPGSYTGAINDGYTLANGDLYVWKSGEASACLLYTSPSPRDS